VHAGEHTRPSLGIAKALRKRNLAAVWYRWAGSSVPVRHAHGTLSAGRVVWMSLRLTDHWARHRRHHAASTKEAPMSRTRTYLLVHAVVFAFAVTNADLSP